jgi:hypothetical protein
VTGLPRLLAPKPKSTRRGPVLCLLASSAATLSPKWLSVMMSSCSTRLLCGSASARAAPPTARRRLDLFWGGRGTGGRQQLLPCGELPGAADKCGR